MTADVRGPDGPYRVTARYLVGCDGAHSRVRDTAGIPFPGITYPEVNRLGQVTVPDSVTRPDNGDLDVPGLGRIRRVSPGPTAACSPSGGSRSGVLLIQTTEDEPAEVDDDAPMTLTEFQDSIRRVLGAELPLGEATRLSRYGFQARQAERYRDGRILLAGDAAHQFPATGIGINVGMLDAVNLAWKLAAGIQGWAPAGLLDTYHDERHFAGARAMLQTQAQVALRRGQDPAAASAAGTLPGTARRRAAIAPPRSPDRRHRHPLPDAWPRPARPDRHLRTRPHPAHRPGHHQRRGTHAPRAAHPPRPRRPPGAARDRPGLAASRRHPHRRNRSSASRRPADPPGRSHRLGRAHRRSPPAPPQPHCEKRSAAGSADRS